MAMSGHKVLNSVYILLLSTGYLYESKDVGV